MGKIIFILGGARSGKSSYAVESAKRLGRKVAFIATCPPVDKEMKERIALHRKKRPSHWQTFEEPKNPDQLVKKISARFNVIIIDCLTLLISSLLSEGLDDAAIEDRIRKLLGAFRQGKCKTIIVSNEVGLGIVPENHLARRFRDLAGRVNQLVTQNSDEVFFMLSGVPLKIKGGGK